jgi:hypothetical protein
MCAAPIPGRQTGFAYIGATLPITMELTLSGTDITGIVSFGSLRGTLTGRDRGAGIFSLQGVIQGAVVLNITQWETQVLDNELVGIIAYEVRFNGVAGNGAASGRFVNVTRR